MEIFFKLTRMRVIKYNKNTDTSDHCKLLDHKKVLENFRKLISHERQGKFRQFLLMFFKKIQMINDV